MSEEMLLMGVIEVIDPYPAIYVPEIDTIAISDLHLGYEGVMAEETGQMIPKTQFKKEMQMLEGIRKRIRAKRIVLNGDVKHEFSTTSYHESKELSDMLEYFQQVYDEVIVVKGNHDNYIVRVTSKFRVELVDEFLEGKYYFLHGHEVPESFLNKGEVVIIGHEHPAVVLYDEVGAKEKVSCLLYGKMFDGRSIIVLPPFSIFAQGSEVNVVPKEELLSPILREYADIDELEAVAISPGIGCLKLAKIGLLRALYVAGP